MDTQRIRVACDVEAVCEFNPTFGLAKQVRKQVHVTTVKGQKRPPANLSNQTPSTIPALLQSEGLSAQYENHLNYSSAKCTMFFVSRCP